jgi:hypothetical protein
VVLTEPEIAGCYVLEERNADGSLLPRPDTSIDAMQRRVGGRPMTDQGVRDTFGDLPADGEGYRIALVAGTTTTSFVMR